MSIIKKFFEKKRIESKFKDAGHGRKLTDTSGSSSHQQAGGSSQSGKRDHHQNVHHRRTPPSNSKAGQAALARLEQKQSHNPTVNWSLTSIRAQAKKELELEMAVAEREKQKPVEISQDSAPILAVSGVYFSCPLLDEEILPKDEIKTKIKNFLYSQLEEEQGLTACLIIRSCNDKEQMVNAGISVLCQYLSNIIENPTEEKYRKIRINNKVFKEKVLVLEGATDFLIAAGFERKQLPHGDSEDEFFIFPEEKLCDLEILITLKEALMSSEAIVPVLDRNLQVLMPAAARERINLPNDFFAFTSGDYKKEQDQRTHNAELNLQLRTKAMREKDEIKEIVKYKYSLIRIRFPDGIILQGTFSVKESFSAVREFVEENLANPGYTFSLIGPGGKRIEEESSLQALHLVPAAILNLSWGPDYTISEESAYLKPEIMILLRAM